VLIIRASFELNPDALLNQEDWPKWLGDGVNYLQVISEEDIWVSLLLSFVELEQQLVSENLNKVS
jgi:hypothetical protein